MVEQRVIDMLKHHEGVKTRWYYCPANLITQGVGHVLYPEQAKLPFAERRKFQIKPEDDREWTMQEVEEVLKRDLVRFERAVDRLCPKTTPGQRGALISFAFNVGAGSLQRSTLRAKHNRGEYEEAAKEFLKWAKAGGKVLPGLLKRRNDEVALYLS